MRGLLGPVSTLMCLRLSNVFGPAQSKGLIPYLVDCIRSKRRITIASDGAQTRDFIYVKDVAACVIRALAAPQWAAHVNVGSGIPTSVMSLLRLLEEVMDAPATGQYCPERTGGERRNTVAVDRASELLDWRATTTLDQGLRSILCAQTSGVTQQVAV